MNIIEDHKFLQDASTNSQQCFIKHRQKAWTVSKILVKGNQTVGYKIPFPISFGFDKNQGLRLLPIDNSPAKIFL